MALKGLWAGLVFAVLGPPIGGLILFLPSLFADLISSLFSGQSLVRLLPLVGSFLLLVSVSSYLFGGLPAVICGVIVGFRLALTGRVDFIFAVLSGVLSSLAFMGLLALGEVQRALRLSNTSAEMFSTISLNHFYFCILSAISAAVCWWLCRRLGLVPIPSHT